ncbi:MAG: sulfatase-like hydrolase/transferase [Labilithrix sp.]|nr:sulfatase-like hydrolase/transferase [Labilithrix sp.]MCW5818033.1 sulfatase-like hydrolase/transferase [Labilithrix sp.]
MALPRFPPSLRDPALRSGLACGGATLLYLTLALAPARAAGAYRIADGLGAQIAWLLGGILRDLAAVALVVAPFVFVVAAAAPSLVARVRGRRWQRAGGMLAAVPLGVALWVLGIAAQEFKHERGAYPTVFDLSAQGTSVVFLRSTLGYLRYDVYWIPALFFGALGLALLARHLRRRSAGDALAWREWRTGLLLSLFAAALVLRLFAAVTAKGTTVGDPFRAMTDSVADLFLYGKRATPRDLVRDARLAPKLEPIGAALLGWPPATATSKHDTCRHHPHERPLDRARERPIADARGEELVRAFEEVSARLFARESEREGESESSAPIVWQLTLESFRGDDLRALNPHAAHDVAPFVDDLYAKRGAEGVLASRATYQAGVRTAQGLGALACGLGTLPYNLSLIRDLPPIRVRCLADVLADAGFAGSFYYGSDPTFDGMSAFFAEHGVREQITQADLPADAPKGAWDAVTDHALVDETTARVAKRVKESGEAPRYVMLTTLSNHSPFAAPEDLPADVALRVDRALASTPNRAGRDDRPRLLTYSYTDAAVERFFAKLDALELTARSIVVLAADHSTGEGYVWGPAEGSESDDAKARIPFAIVLPAALRERVRDRAALEAALTRAQRALDAGPLSQNDIPSLVLALLASEPHVKSLPAAARWHTLGGQVTSPWFREAKDAYIAGINGVSQLVAFDRSGARARPYEDSVFLNTRGDRETVTPSLVPVTACLSALLHAEGDPCAN